MANGILVIYGKRDTLERIRDVLVAHHYIAHTNIRADEGVKMAEEIQPELILLDADIRHGRGLDVARELRASERTKNIPIMLLTTPYKSAEFIQEGIELGLDGFIFVPFDEIEFISKVYVGLRIKNYIDVIAERDRSLGLLDLEYEKLEQDHARALSNLSSVEKTLEEERITDTLTGLYNKKELYRRISTYMYECVRFEETIVAFYYDIDHLRVIETEFGDVIATEVIKTLAKLIKRHAREEDFVARYGDDEFVVIYKRMRYDFIDEIVRRVQEEIESAEIMYGETALRFSACIGVSCNVYSHSYRIDLGEDPLKEAKLALRNAKRRGTGKTFVHPLIKKR